MLAEYDFEVVYKPGRLNIEDALPRNAVKIVLVISAEKSGKNSQSINETPGVSQRDKPEAMEIEQLPKMHIMSTRTRAGRGRSLWYLEAIETLLPARRKKKGIEQKEQNKNSQVPARNVSENKEAYAALPFMPEISSDLESGDRTIQAVMDLMLGERRNHTPQSEPSLISINEYCVEEDLQAKPRPLTQQHEITGREQLFMRRDNYLNFVTTFGDTCDEGARQFIRHNKLPKLK